MPEVGATLLPITSFVAVSTKLGERLDTAMSYRGAVSDTHAADYHYRIVDDDRLMWAGGLSMWDADPQRWKAQFSQAVVRTYPQPGPIEFEYAWSGVLGMPLHRMPQIGEVSSGLWLASGFGSQGLNTTAMAGRLIARAVVENDDRWRLFNPFNLVWA